jgi:beta-lactamase class A
MPAAAQDQADRLAAQVEAITAPLVGRVGFAGQLIGSDKIISHNGDMNFPMASVYKVPAAVTLLKKVEAGEVKLDHMVELTLDDMVAGDNVIALNFVHPGLQLSVANLIEAMITMSDNTATDAVISLAGGPKTITAAMRKLGIKDMRIDRNIKDIFRDVLGMDGPATVAAVEEFLQSNPEMVTQLVTFPKNPKYEADPRDQSTPLAMLDLLMKIDSATAISEDSRDFLIASMSRTRTGAGRIKGLLPRGTPVAHKTGTSSGVANDVGYVTLPDGRRFAIAIFTGSSDTPMADRDRALAEVARTLYDYFATKSLIEDAPKTKKRHEP